MHTTNDLPLVAILRGVTPDEVLAHIEAIVRAGFTTVEIPLNSPDWQQSIALAVKHYGGKMRVGAGTVTDVSNIPILAALGCQFILTPNTDPAVITAARAHGMEVCVGCQTASEAFSALRSGASSLKIFPAGEVGAGYIRALRAVLPADAVLYAVGGITTDNLVHYLRAGCNGVGLGSDLYRAGQPVAKTHEQAQAFMLSWQTAQRPPALS
ncbi:TPA: 2-dehydro-3-deoxy-6-phosphogalactonate aldolase [Klebsiella oxytoca]|nr:2-dehydro-3-deoxy-6-phosphogalactonate aldolase [Klebsiella oxytoca]